MADPKPNAQLFRRDFLTGAAGGLAAGLGATQAAAAYAPADLTARLLLPKANLSYAQQGEDVLVKSLFDRVLRVPAPSYLDVGAFDPVECNNTYLFYLRGGRGVLVEPNVDLGPKLRRARPGDVTLTAGVGTTDQAEADYYLLGDPQLNTFSKDQADRLVREGATQVRGVVKMPLVNINRVIADHFGGGCPDYLSIDIEGLDCAVLKTLDFGKYRPKIICTDTLVTNTPRHRTDTAELLAGHGYEVRGMTYANTVFMDKALF